MNVTKQDRAKFLLLAVVALFILLINIPRFDGVSNRVSGERIFNGDMKVQLEDSLHGSSFFAGIVRAGKKSSSACDDPPRLAILMFEPFDLNRADIETLSFVRGIGAKLAARIIERREQVGSFFSVDDLLDVKGIGVSKLKALKKGVIVCQ